MNRRMLAAITAATLLPATLIPATGQTASHREAPITSIDRTADITDFFAFVSPDDPSTVTAILCTDPLLEPGNGPNYFPFDPDVLYEIHVDNDHDALEDVAFVFRFFTDVRFRGVPVGFAGAGDGLAAPPNSPRPVRPGAPIVPPAVTSLEGAGAAGIGIRQTFAVAVRRNGNLQPLSRSGGGAAVVVPSNVGPRTMPDYARLYRQGVQQLQGGIKVFAGTVDDAFYIDLGAAFDSLNFRKIPGGSGIAGVLTAGQDADDTRNFSADDVSGYNVNCISIQVPMAQLSASGRRPLGADPLSQIGLWGTTSRAELTVRRPGRPVDLSGASVQVQRMANPLFDELLIGTDRKDLWSRSQPAQDAQFSDLILDPLIVRVGQAAFAAVGAKLDLPDAPRRDLGVLAFYSKGPRGPLADLLRLDLSVPPTPRAQRRRLGGCAGDPGGFPNGRRTTDDVLDCFLRVGFGILVPGFNKEPNSRIGDGVNVNDRPIPDTFPFLAPANNGRASRHGDPGEGGCAGGACPVDD